MLKDLKIKNGELSVKFDPLNTRYTVNMLTNDRELQIEYTIDPQDEISIYNNPMSEEQNEVVITVYNDEEMMSYYLEVHKEEDKSVNQSTDYFSSIEVEKERSMPGYIAPAIGTTCFILILIFYCILFKKRKNAKS